MVGTVTGRGPILYVQGYDYLPRIQLKGCHSPMEGTRAWVCSKTWRQEAHHCWALHCDAHARAAGPSFPFGWLMRLFSWDHINTAKLLSTALASAALLGNCFFTSFPLKPIVSTPKISHQGWFWSLKMDEDVCCSQQEPCCMPTKRKENKSLHCHQNQLW